MVRKKENKEVEKERYVFWSEKKEFEKKGEREEKRQVKFPPPLPNGLSSNRPH